MRNEWMEGILLLKNKHDLSSYHRNTSLPEESSSQNDQKVWGWAWNADPEESLRSGSSQAPFPRCYIYLSRVFTLKALICLLPLRLLYSVLPPSVANELRHKRPVPAKRYDNLTILFSGIVGFNAFCSKHASAEGAIKIVNLLNDVYTRFDILTDSRKNPYVYKVGSSSSTATVCRKQL